MSNKNAREIVVDILEKVEKEGAYSNIALKQILDNHPNLILADKRLITEITNGTIKYIKRIDYIIDKFSKTPTKKMKPIIRYIMRMSVYQILFLDKVPDSAVCNEAVKIAKKRKMGNLSGFVNGVLRNIVRNHKSITYSDLKSDSIKYLSVVYSFPEWIIEMWLKSYSYEFVEELCIATNKAPDVSIRVNQLLISKEELQRELEQESLAVEDGTLVTESLRIKGVASIGELTSFKKGYFTVQDESSMLATRVLDPRPNERIFDVCGAPGGKTTHIAERMGNKGLILSGDIFEHKLELIGQTARRMKHTIVEPVLQDATKINDKYIGQFDRILIDAPCSGLGIIRKKPDIRWKKSYKDIPELVKIQKQIINVCSQYLKPNGVMVYSTCTISEMENQQIVNWIINNLDFELESIEGSVPDCLYSEQAKKGYIQIFPSDANTDGFFISRFRKRG